MSRTVTIPEMVAKVIDTARRDGRVILRGIAVCGDALRVLVADGTGQDAAHALGLQGGWGMASTSRAITREWHGTILGTRVTVVTVEDAAVAA